MNDLAKRIKERREELGLSQTQLAFKLGYKSRSSINKIEKGENDIPPSKIKWFAEVLNISPTELMGWDEIIKEAVTGVKLREIFEIINCKIEPVMYADPPQNSNEFNEYYVDYYVVKYDEKSIKISLTEYELLIKEIRSFLRFKINELHEKHIND